MPTKSNPAEGNGGAPGIRELGSYEPANTPLNEKFQGAVQPRPSCVDAAVCSSLIRIIATAPIENKPRLFGFLARTALDGMTQALWEIADDIGLVDQIGATLVADIIRDVRVGRGA